MISGHIFGLAVFQDIVSPLHLTLHVDGQIKHNVVQIVSAPVLDLMPIFQAQIVLAVID